MRRDDVMKRLLAFEKAAPYLQAALDHDRTRGYDLEYVKDRVMSGAMQLWLGDDWAAVTEVLNYPKKRTVLVHLAGGRMGALLEHDSELTRFAQTVGAQAIEVIGRKGWARKLQGMGYQEAAVHLIKEVPHG